MMNGKYIYGIITGSDEIRFDISGLGGSSPVYTIAHQGLNCVVSDYSGREFGSKPKEEVVRLLLAHQQVVEHAMQGRTVLPVKFGTLLAISNEVRNLLSQGHQQFVDALAWIQDKVEVEVAATWDIKRALQEVGHEDEVVRAKQAVGSSESPSLNDRVRLGQAVEACLDRRRDGYRRRMLEFLRPLAIDVAPNALVAEEMVMNVAFLVERARQQEFDERVRVLDSLFDNQVTFRVIGPLPPYSFSAVEITRLSEEQIEQARQALELPAVFVEADVRKAYRRLAAREHQKAQNGTKASAEGLARVRQASEVLLACSRAQTAHLPQADGASSGENEKGRCLFAVAVRGTGYQEIAAARFGGAVRV